MTYGGSHACPPTVLAATLLTAFLVGIGAAPALAEPGTGPGVSDPPRASAEATVVAMRHQGGLFGAQETAITDPQTPYPTTITGTGRTFSTAQIVLNDPNSSSPGDIPSRTRERSPPALRRERPGW